jgi:hypothetical protein
MEDLDKGIIVMLRIWIPPDHLLSPLLPGPEALPESYDKLSSKHLPGGALLHSCCAPHLCQKLTDWMSKS